jgi:hypothetical protein
MIKEILTPSNTEKECNRMKGRPTKKCNVMQKLNRTVY